MTFATYPSLSGRTVFVTGGASGIGASLVEQFHAQGCKVAFVDLQAKAGEALAARLGELTWFRACDVTDADDYSQYLSGHQIAICCLGVGQPSKVSKEEFVKIDKTAALDFATACKQAGVWHFQLLSSVGADARSRSFYLRTKGELQDAIIALGFERVSFFQPSMILTPTNRYGFMQGMMLAVWPALSGVLQGGLRKYRGTRVETLGHAIAKNAITTGQGVQILQWDQINSL